MRVAELVVEGVALAQSAHVDFDAVASDFACQGELADFLAFENHPVAHGDFITFSLRTQGEYFGRQDDEH